VNCYVCKFKLCTCDLSFVIVWEEICIVILWTYVSYWENLIAFVYYCKNLSWSGKREIGNLRKWETNLLKWTVGTWSLIESSTKFLVVVGCSNGVFCVRIVKSVKNDCCTATSWWRFGARAKFLIAMESVWRK